MVHTSRRLIAATAVAVLVAGSLGAAPISAARPPGDLTIGPLPRALLVKDSSIALRLRYNCVPYDLGSGDDSVETIIVTPTGATAYRNVFTRVVCDGTDRQVDMALPAYGFDVRGHEYAGPGTLQVRHCDFGNGTGCGASAELAVKVVVKPLK